jgi:phosphonoacetaldehyde hydrolase
MTPFRHVKAVVLDWAGTMIDFGSAAPMGSFVEVFRRLGVEISVEEARKPMGLPKRAHVTALLAEPGISERWRSAHGAVPGEAEIDAVYEAFLPLNREVVADFADLVPGAAEVAAQLRARGLKIGSTTGYTRDIMERVLPAAARQGYAADNMVCADDVPAGRPTPLMMYRTFADLGVFPPSAVVKVDDTEPGIAEGVAAGSWTVGVTDSGNLVGKSLAEWDAIPEKERASLRSSAASTLRGAGAHFVIDTVAALIPVIEKIDAILESGRLPTKSRSRRLAPAPSLSG